MKSATWSWLCLGLLGNLLCIGPLSAEEPIPTSTLPTKLADNPFQMCKRAPRGPEIRIRVARHRSIVIHRVPGQYMPRHSRQARLIDYVHFVTLRDLTNGRLRHGAIAFTTDHAVIYTPSHPDGISRPRFVASLSSNEQLLAQQALDIFLRLHRVFNAAIEACLPYPAEATYATDDYIERIETGKQRYKSLVAQFNAQPRTPGPLYQPSHGKTGGFVDPDAGQETKVSYHAMNPLNFYRPLPAPYTPY